MSDVSKRCFGEISRFCSIGEAISLPHGCGDHGSITCRDWLSFWRRIYKRGASQNRKMSGLTLASDCISLLREMRLLDAIIPGDSREVLRKVPPESVDLVVTSPPYADRRSRVYGGVKPDHYVEWFLPIADELQRVLKPTGSFVLNIKEIVVDGERHTYVIELILAMRKRGWLWTEEYVWHKKNCYPGRWPNRFRDAWERYLHFTKQKKFSMYQEAVMVPMGDWRHSRLRNLSETDRIRDNSHVNSGFGKRIQNWVGRDMAYPSNVLHLPTEFGQSGSQCDFQALHIGRGCSPPL